MKILFLTYHLKSGGAERTTVYLAEYMAIQGHETTILTFSEEMFYTPKAPVQVDTLHIPTEFSSVSERYKHMFLRWKSVREYVKKYAPDVVVSLMPHNAKYILGLKRKMGFKLITSERINPAVVGKKGLKLRTKVYQKSDGIVFQTQRAMDFYKENIRKKGMVIHNAVGNSHVYEVPETIKRKPKISAMGRLSDQKDYETLIRAFGPIAEKYPAYTLEIYGTGPDEEKLKVLTKELGLVKQVHFCGACEDAILKIADSACYVMSSKYEGMPNALMEAMAVGLPCVSTDCPNGPAELIENGENGLLVPVGDTNALTIAMFTMIERKMLANKYGHNAKRILETHSVEKNAKAYLNYILKIYNKDE